MDPVSKDALNEAKEVLEGLAGFLSAVNTAQRGTAHPVLNNLSLKLQDIAEEFCDLNTMLSDAMRGLGRLH